MLTRTTRAACATLVMLAMLPAARVWGQAEPGTLASAVRLYEGAAFAEALGALDRLDETSVAAAERPLVQQYRALCFVALDRRPEAVAAFEALVAQFPEYTPAGPDLPPRVKRLFDETRERVLPGILRERYAAGRAAYDSGDYAEAAARFEGVIAFGAEGGRELQDLAVLARGFRDLARQRIENAAIVPPALEAADAGGAPLSSVTPPVVIDQRMPSWPVRVPLDGHRAGLLEIVIAPDGSVARAVLRRPVHPAYDPLLLAAARQWRYTPAMQDGRPAAYVKQLRIDVGK